VQARRADEHSLEVRGGGAATPMSVSTEATVVMLEAKERV
jgi:hypothetical protein